MSKRKFLFAAALVLSGFGAIPCSASSSSWGYSNHDLRGSYGFYLEGEVTAGSIQGPIFGVGRIVADGEGHFTSAVRTINVGGQLILQQTAVGTYTVHPDGTGSATFTVTSPDSPGAVNRFDFVLAGKDDMHAIASDPGLSVVAFATKQKMEHGYDRRDVRGDYGFHVRGRATTGPIVGPLAAEGRLTADGAGHVTSAIQRTSLNGQAFVTQTAVGSYAVNSNGTGTAVFLFDDGVSPQPVELHSAFVVIDRNTVFSVVTTPGSTSLTRLSRQRD